MIWGGEQILIYALLAAGIVLCIAWALVRRFASRKLRANLLPIFAGLSAGLFLGIIYVLTDAKTALLLALPIAVIVYFNITGRKKKRK